MRRILIVALLHTIVMSAIAAVPTFQPDHTALDGILTRLDGDCRAGSFDFDGYQGWYGDFWGPDDAYAALISPGDGSCLCTEGVVVQDVHIIMYVNIATVFVVQAELWSATDVGGCQVPLAPLAVSLPVQYSDFPGTGNANLEIPFDSPCLAPGDDYFVVVRFLPGTTGLFIGVPVDSSPAPCTTWVNRSGLAGWHDVVGEYGWLGNFYVYADLNCCSDPVAAEGRTWGEMKALYR